MIKIDRRKFAKGRTPGFKHSEETKKKMSLTQKGIPRPYKGGRGENHYNWKGGDAQYRRNHAPRPKPKECEVCKSTRKICYDHDHTTNKFRGWICHNCNMVLGLVYDNPETLQTLIKYLQSSKNIL